MKSNTKDWIQYLTAIVMVSSGIVLAFLSFFLNHHDIESGVLMYVGEALIYAGGEDIPALYEEREERMKIFLQKFPNLGI